MEIYISFLDYLQVIFFFGYTTFEPALGGESFEAQKTNRRAGNQGC